MILVAKICTSLLWTWVWSMVWEDPLEKRTATHSSIWAWEFHALYSPWRQTVAQTESICLQCGRPGFDPWVGMIPWRWKCNPLQYSCLENPMDGEAWYRLPYIGLQRAGHDWATSLSLLPLWFFFLPEMISF